MSDFKNKVSEVKEAFNIVDYIEASGVTLKPNGVGKFKGLCFAHSEKTPSMVVSDVFQNYKCFGCGASGDLLSFVQEYESLSFSEALQSLADKAGIEIEQDTESTINYRGLRAVMKDTTRFFRVHFSKLPETHVAKQQVTDRGLSLDKMAYGYAPEGRTALYDFLRKRGHRDQEIVETGVCYRIKDSSRIVDFWNGRLMFFILDITGNPVGFSGRKVFENDTHSGKYVNTKDMPLFNKHKTLYNIYSAKKVASEESSIYVSEGQFDVSALVEAGVPNVVASSGTAFGEDQSLMCRRLVGESGEIIFCFDGDLAGIKAAKKVFENTPIIHPQAYAIPFPKDTDPCDLRQDLGNEEFFKYLKKNKTPLVGFVLDSLLEEFDMGSEMGRTQYINEALSVLSGITSLSLRDSFLRQVALHSFTQIGMLREMLKNTIKTPNRQLLPTVEEDEDKTVISDDEKEQKLLSIFGGNEALDLSYRIMAAIIGSNELTEAISLEELQELFPNILKPLLNTVYEGGVFVAEKYAYPLLMERIVEEMVSPLYHLMNDQVRLNHYNFLLKELRSLHSESRLLRSYRQTLDAISGSNDINVLKAALDMEKKLNREVQNT